jgi:hypothetical protein
MHTQQTRVTPQPIEARPDDNNVIPHRAKVRTLGVFTSNPDARLAVALEASQKECQLLLPWSTFSGLTPRFLRACVQDPCLEWLPWVCGRSRVADVFHSAVRN